jgi:hypothetical protein
MENKFLEIKAREILNESIRLEKTIIESRIKSFSSKIIETPIKI